MDNLEMFVKIILDKVYIALTNRCNDIISIDKIRISILGENKVVVELLTQEIKNKQIHPQHFELISFDINILSKCNLDDYIIIEMFQPSNNIIKSNPIRIRLL